MAAEFFSNHMPQTEKMFISNPTWGLEKACFEFGSKNITTEMYPYWDD